MAFYLDTSAAAKLVVAEPASEAVASWAATNETRVIASDLLRTELLRATSRAAPDRMQRARSVLDAFTLFTLTSATFERAATLDPSIESKSCGGLDALHLAAALELGDELDGIVTYDSRKAAAASLYGVADLRPPLVRVPGTPLWGRPGRGQITSVDWGPRYLAGLAGGHTRPCGPRPSRRWDSLSDTGTRDSAKAGLLAHKGGDAVAVAVRDLAPGEVQVAHLDDGEQQSVMVKQDVPLGHKVALMDIPEGGEVIEYGQRIGLARSAIATGDYVHVHNLRSAKWQPTS